MGYRVEITNSSNSKKLVLRQVQNFRISKVYEDLLRFGIPGMDPQGAQITSLAVAYEDISVEFLVKAGDDVNGSMNFLSIPDIINYVYSDFYTTQNISVSYVFRLIDSSGNVRIQRTGAVASIDFNFDAGKAELATGSLKFMVGTVL